MGPRAQWFLESVELKADPFEAPIEEVGTPIDLRTETDLLVRLAALLQAEGDLDGAGVRCAVRERSDSVCSACPISQAARDTPQGELCRNGIAQERVLTHIAVGRERDAK